jgi:hypothetical protein
MATVTAMANRVFPDDPKSSAALPQNFINPQGELIGPADFFLNHSGLTGDNLEAALASVGLEVLLDDDGKIVGAASKRPPKGSHRRRENVLRKSFYQPQSRKEPEVLNFDHKRKIELEQ